jgi:hypothetical protein
MEWVKRSWIMNEKEVVGNSGCSCPGKYWDVIIFVRNKLMEET